MSAVKNFAHKCANTATLEAISKQLMNVSTNTYHQGFPNVLMELITWSFALNVLELFQSLGSQ